jgi:hypothetical protein
MFRGSKIFLVGGQLGGYPWPIRLVQIHGMVLLFFN